MGRAARASTWNRSVKKFFYAKQKSRSDFFWRHWAVRPGPVPTYHRSTCGRAGWHSKRRAGWHSKRRAGGRANAEMGGTANARDRGGKKRVLLLRSAINRFEHDAHFRIHALERSIAQALHGGAPNQALNRSSVQPIERLSIPLLRSSSP